MAKNDLQKILSDNISGSTELVFKINKFFKKNCEDIKLIKQSLPLLNFKMKSFEEVINYVNDLNRFIATGDFSGMEKFLHEFQNKSDYSFYKIYLNIKPLLKNTKRIYTLSNSKTVYEVLKYLNEDKNLATVIIAESRPVLEGRILAKKLLKLGIEVTQIPDCDSANYISICDAVLIGADKILSSGDIVNKTGSKSSAIIAKYFNKPVYVLASDKKISKQKIFRQELQNPKEIWQYVHQNLKIVNCYFEVIPRNLISKVITESNVY